MSGTSDVRLEDAPCPLGCERSDEPVLHGHDEPQGRLIAAGGRSEPSRAPQERVALRAGLGPRHV